jgi:predicted kinase
LAAAAAVSSRFLADRSDTWGTRWVVVGYKYNVAYSPTLVVISGPSGVGKTTLAHKIARAVGCPAVCRDEVKEGMMHAAPGFVAGPGDELTMRTLPVFFDVLALLLKARVTTVAEAAFQDWRWRAGLEPLGELAQLRIVHCTVSAEVAFERSLQRGQAVPTRQAHADPGPSDAAEFAARHSAFERLSIDAPSIDVDTTDGYRPGLSRIVAFVNGGMEAPPYRPDDPRW